jgi:hypothetical protein
MTTELTLDQQIALWDAEDAAALAVDKARTAYYALITEIEAKANPDNVFYLTDENVDWENSSHHAENTVEFWGAMATSAADAAGMRAEEYGLDLTALLGRSIY